MQPVPTVFIVDDDAAVRKALAQGVELMQWHAETFGSAEAFLEAYQPRQTACLVLNLTMPGMGGLELMGRLEEAGIVLPVILISGLPLDDQQKQELEARATALLQKPFRMGELIAAIQKALGLSGEPPPE